MLESEMRDDFINFLRGNFHQDIESVEDAIEEILDEEGRDYLIYATEFITIFLNSDTSDENKINVVRENTSIFYEDKSQYILLIINILNRIKKKLEKS
ncbi:contact-dependent growth inhibition system immunity protein [Clostridium sp. CTA-7]